MWKKVLLTIVAVLIAGGALMIYGTYKVVDNTLKEKEPQLRQYMQLNEAEQNKYILEHAQELLSQIDLNKDGKPEEKEQLELLIKVNEKPEVQEALVDLGRALMAMGLTASEAIVKDMSADVKSKYEAEANNFTERFEKYAEIVGTIEPRLKHAE